MINRGLVLETERATLLGWRPLHQREDDGWVLSSNNGVISRLCSAAPLDGGDGLVGRIKRAEAFYHALGQPCRFRVTEELAPPGLTEALAALGYAPQSGAVEIRARPAVQRPRPADVSISSVPTEVWSAVFAGKGFSAADSEARAATYARSSGMHYATLMRDGRAAAVGLLAAGPFAGIHGMRTAPDARRTGAATMVLHALEAVAVEAGAHTLFLHVDDVNAPAVALYAREGFALIGQYRQWEKPLQPAVAQSSLLSS
jgi:GNAT superfamily N-acetyltransferase